MAHQLTVSLTRIPYQPKFSYKAFREEYSRGYFYQWSALPNSFDTEPGLHPENSAEMR